MALIVFLIVVPWVLVFADHSDSIIRGRIKSSVRATAQAIVFAAVKSQVRNILAMLLQRFKQAGQKKNARQ
ncbi:MAG: hypothetical protein HZA91_01705 [Verrucomicrobia bacterium]|nr:hypothetical protein [Verrucomicrobiota bacterium]